MSLAFDDILALNVGDIVYECSSGENLRERIVIAPVLGEGYEGKRTVSWTGENTVNGVQFPCMVTETLEHYGPRLYLEPQYARIVEGVVVFKLYGEE